MRAVWEERLSLICYKNSVGRTSVFVGKTSVKTYKNSVGRTSVIERTSIITVTRIVWEEQWSLKCIDNESSVGRTSVINMLQE